MILSSQSQLQTENSFQYGEKLNKYLGLLKQLKDSLDEEQSRLRNSTQNSKFKVPFSSYFQIKGVLYHRLEIAVRCFKNPLGALAKSVVGRAMSSCCGGDRNLPSASDICRAADPSQVRDVRLTHALECTASCLTGMG
ncbi:hypothetical protein J6590_002832 [Homalodisca vitripennis]|nr:hypothetical protein J6590_002832 [Homalodisca vitripennis]